MHRGLPTQIGSLVEQQRVDGQITPHAAGLQYLHPVTGDVAFDRAGDGNVVGLDLGDNPRSLADDQVAGDIYASLEDAVNADAAVGLDLPPEVGIGANDETMAPLYGSRILNMKQILILATIFAITGAILLGEGVAKSVGDKILLIDYETTGISQSAVVMTILISTAIWLILSSALGLPISSTHSTIGGIMGLGIRFIERHAKEKGNSIYPFEFGHRGHGRDHGQVPQGGAP